MVKFSAARLKIDRAKRHLDELRAQVGVYLARDPYVGLKMRDMRTGEYFMSSLSRELPPDELSLVFGDLLFNLRSSLDILANDLVRHSGREPKNVYFPFAGDEAGLEEQITSKMRGAAPDILELVRGFEPYRGGNEYLRALHDLNIRDKHIELLGAGAGQAMIFDMSTGVPTGPNSFRVDFERLQSMPIDPTGFPVREGTEVVGKLVGSRSFVHIGEGLPLTGTDIIEAGEQLIDIVSAIVSTFEDHCSGTQRDLPR